jgi:hypothetical protein
MRRRMGAPSNYLETAGKSMARMHKTSDEQYSEQSAAGSARIPMGMDAYKVDPVAPEIGTLVPKKNLQAGDPVNPGSKSGRRNPVLNPGGERLGAAYSPKATYMVVDPAAGLTMRNARVIPSVAGRSMPNFGMEIQASQQ